MRPWFGIEGYPLGRYLYLALTLDLPVENGILVANVYRGSSAARAGIRGYRRVAIIAFERYQIGGDIITEIDGNPVNSFDDLQFLLESKRPDDVVQVTFYRDGSKMEKAVTLVEAPARRSRRF